MHRIMTQDAAIAATLKRVQTPKQPCTPSTTVHFDAEFGSVVFTNVRVYSRPTDCFTGQFRGLYVLLVTRR